MKSEQEHKLFAKLKEEFESATDLENYSYTVEFEINRDYSDDDELVCDVVISGHYEETIIQLSIDTNEKLTVNEYEDTWEEWTSFNYKVSNLWRVMFFKKQDKEED